MYLLHDIMGQIETVSHEPGFKYCQWGLLSTILGSEF